MGMGEEQDQMYVDHSEKAYIAAPPVGKTASQRMAEDLHWFEEQFAAEFPYIPRDSNDYMLARYWYLAALQRAADYESVEVKRIGEQVQAALDHLRADLG